DPAGRIGTLPLLPAAERHQLLVAWNATEEDAADDRPVTEQVARAAARHLERLALVGDGHELSYGELEARANRLAHHLLGLGVGPDVPVGLCVERSPELVVAALAILKAGGAYVPLDPDFPRERLAFYAKDSRMPVLVS